MRSYEAKLKEGGGGRSRAGGGEGKVMKHHFWEHTNKVYCNKKTRMNTYVNFKNGRTEMD